MTLSDYLLLNLSDYENIQIDMPINMIILAFAVGIVIATLLLGFYRSAVQNIVKQLTRHDAINEATAKTLSDLSLSGKRYVLVLRSSSMLKKMVARVGEDEGPSSETENGHDESNQNSAGEQTAAINVKGKENSPEIDYSTAAFYLRSSGEERSKRVLSGYESSLISSILLAVLVLAITICIMLCMPSILKLLNNILGWF